MLSVQAPHSWAEHAPHAPLPAWLPPPSRCASAHASRGQRGRVCPDSAQHIDPPHLEGQGEDPIQDFLDLFQLLTTMLAFPDARSGGVPFAPFRSGRPDNKKPANLRILRDRIEIQKGGPEWLQDAPGVTSDHPWCGSSHPRGRGRAREVTAGNKIPIPGPRPDLQTIRKSQ